MFIIALSIQCIKDLILQDNVKDMFLSLLASIDLD